MAALQFTYRGDVPEFHRLLFIDYSGFLHSWKQLDQRLPGPEFTTTTRQHFEHLRMTAAVFEQCFQDFLRL